MNAPEQQTQSTVRNVSNDVLAERILNIGLQVTTLGEKLDKALIELARVPVIERDVNQLQEQQNRTFSKLKEIDETNELQEKMLTEINTRTKLIGAASGTLATIAMALCAWLYSQLTALHDADVNAAMRIQTLEIKSQLQEAKHAANTQ